ncbi:MAG: J domain-containing protein [Sporomusaceae bacterium]|nr:J domain-containing protein [Sporomusaceae bacterium]
MLGNYYEILELSPKASPEEIQKAYRRLVKKHHPDISTDKEAATAKMAQLNQAYEILSDPIKRQAFDAQLLSLKAVKQTKRRPHRAASKSFIRRNTGLSYGVAALCLLFIFYVLSVDKPQTPSESNQATATSTALFKGEKGKTNILTQLLPQDASTKQAGNHSITIANRQSSLPLYGRLWLLSGTPQPVRAFTIRAGEQLILDRLTPGNYEIHYMYLYEEKPAATAFKTQPFLLVAKEVPNETTKDFMIELILPQPATSPPYPLDRDAL